MSFRAVALILLQPAFSENLPFLLHRFPQQQKARVPGFLDSRVLPSNIDMSLLSNCSQPEINLSQQKSPPMAIPCLSARPRNFFNTRLNRSVIYSSCIFFLPTSFSSFYQLLLRSHKKSSFYDNLLVF